MPEFRQDYAGVLENWVYDKKNNVIVGSLVHDCRGRFGDYDRIRTSLIQKISDDGLLAYTLNSIYELSPPFEKG